MSEEHDEGGLEQAELESRVGSETEDEAPDTGRGGESEQAEGAAQGAAAAADEPAATTADEPAAATAEEAAAPARAAVAPSVTRITPARVDVEGGSSVTVYGAGFVPGCRVMLGDEELVAELVDPFCMRFIAPKRAMGSYAVHVESAGGTRSNAEARLEFVEGPRIERVEPREGPLDGGVEVRIFGRNFPEGCTLQLFGASAPELERVGPGELRFVLPPVGDGPREGELVIMGPDGLSGRAEGVFSYRRLVPRIESVEPKTAWVNGSKQIALRGADLHPAARVTIGGAPAEARFRDESWIDVVVPAREAPGPVDVLYEDRYGGRVLLEAGLVYEPVPTPPKLIDVLPATGPTTGGVTIRLVGDHFGEHVRVRIAELSCVRKLLSSKLIDVELPARTLPGKVAIELDDGAVVVRTEEIFEYVSPKAPVITSLEPRSGPVMGGTKVIIEGEGFPPDASVRFGSETAKTVAVKSASRIETVSPKASAAGLVDLVVGSSIVGLTISKAAFRYDTIPAPVLSSVAPNRGTTNGGTELGLEGKNFAEGCVVLVGGKPAKTRRVSGSILEAFTPPGDDGQLVDVAVKNPDGQQAVQKRAFQYDARYRG